MTTSRFRPNPGDRFETNFHGTLEVVEYIDSFRVVIRFLNTGYVTTVRSVQIRTGQIRDRLLPSLYGVGYMGVGEHKGRHKINGKSIHTPEYQLWANILQRGYCEKYKKKRPTYQDCYVDSSWHNFQTFCDDLPSLEGYQEWKDSYLESGKSLMAIDKDIKIPGNKCYSKDACIFVTAVENSIEARKRKVGQDEF